MKLYTKHGAGFTPACKSDVLDAALAYRREDHPVTVNMDCPETAGRYLCDALGHRESETFAVLLNQFLPGRTVQ